MRKVRLYNVAPAVPPELEFLETLARNLWWCWNTDAIELFRRINPLLWIEAGHNPLEFLCILPQKRLEVLTEDDGFMSHMHQVSERFDMEVLRSRSGRPSDGPGRCVAYFSVEYGIHESVKLYSGGLGCLAGDHLKEASDRNLPLVAVGLLYRQGYFQQYLNSDGWQQETYPEHDLHHLPVARACDSQARQVEVQLPLPEGVLKAVVWRVDVGRVRLFLLDANIPDNPPALRQVAAQLYPSDRQLRLRQELLLGITGFQALIALGYDPVVCHMNEGHAAFVGLARIAHLRETHGLDVDSAAEVVSRTSVFTTHTPVPAGNEAFAVDLVTPHMEALRGSLGIGPERLLAWGQPPKDAQSRELSMTILGLRMAHFSNGVSRLHGEVERKMWQHLWPERPVDEVPIGYVTNGVHVPSWLSADNVVLYDRYLGPGWRDSPGDPAILAEISQIPDEELWHTHEIGRSRLIRTSRDLLEKQFRMRNAPAAAVAQAKSVLDHSALTIGFARRFATYKRAALLLRDPARLEAILTNDQRPVQIIFSGKAHPADDQGKDLIRQIVRFARNPKIRRRVVFLENYDIDIARCMVQGTDVWLNTPRRPLEASGTSGMKAAVNGVLNLAVLDGWWCEGYSPECGWSIGRGEEYQDPDYQDTVESQALYNLLESEVIPRFYDRPAGDVPAQWTRMMKACMKMAMAYFTSHRMISEYQTCYDQAMTAYDKLMADRAQRARDLVEQRKRLLALWGKVRMERPLVDKDLSTLHVGGSFDVTAVVHLGDLRTDEVSVQVYHGPVNSENAVTESHFEEMEMAESCPAGAYVYKHRVTCRATGRYGLTARVKPRGGEWEAIIPGFIAWADGA